MEKIKPGDDEVADVLRGTLIKQLETNPQLAWQSICDYVVQSGQVFAQDPSYVAQLIREEALPRLTPAIKETIPPNVQLALGLVP